MFAFFLLSLTNHFQNLEQFSFIKTPVHYLYML